MTFPTPAGHDVIDNCAVLLFCDTQVFSCRLRKDIDKSTNKTAPRWVQQNIELDGQIAYRLLNVVTCNGVLYGQAQIQCDNWTYFRVLITIEFEEDNSKFLTFKSLGLKDPPGRCIHSYKRHNYWVESCGLVYQFTIWVWPLDVKKHIIKVEVWQLDLCNMIWVPVEYLGNRTFFLGRHCSTWCWAGTGHDPSSKGGNFESNCVYLLIRGLDTILYSYRLQDHSFTLLLPCPDLQTPFCSPSWVMPPHQRILVPSELCKQLVEKAENYLNGRANVVEHRELELQEPNKTQDNLLCELPSDMIPLISKYLHLFDYLNLRASCKTFHSTVPLDQWRENKPLPLFMFSKNDNALCELRDPCRNDSYYVVISHTPAVPTGIEFSKDGWLVLCTEGESLMFFNPFMRVKGEFPPYEYTHDFASLGFPTCPTSSDCVTVGIHNVYAEMFSLRFEDETWQQHLLDHGDGDFQPSPYSPGYHKESFYFLDRFGYLGVFKLVLSEASWKIYDRPQTYDDLLHSCHLVECDGELLSVFIGEVGSWVQVFRFNHLKNNWVELKRLDNHILFIGHRSSFSAIARESQMGNRIYIPWRKGNDIVFYSLESGKYHVVGCEDPMENFYGLKGQSLSCWVSLN